MRNAKWITVSLLVVLMDQVSKYFAYQFLLYQEPVKLTPFFNLALNFNTGAAFSFLGNAGGWQVYLFAGLSIIISIILFAWLWQLPPHKRLKAFGLSLIIGGAVGNLIDRVRLGYVIDFFDFHLGNWHFATFNVADSAVCVGAFFLILCMIFYKNKAS